MKLIKGKYLSGEAKREVLSAFVHRNTLERPCSMVGTAAKLTDIEWLNEHAFYVTNSGTLSLRHKHCEPKFMGVQS